MTEYLQLTLSINKLKKDDSLSLNETYIDNKKDTRIK